MDAHTSERVFQMIGGLLQVGITVAAHHQVVVRIDQLFPLPGHDFLYLLDVLHGHLVARIGNTCVAVFLLFQQRKLPFLVRNENHLVVNDRPRFRDLVNGRHHINRHLRVVHLDVGKGTYQAGQVDAVHVHK
nr:MAG TPA: hypothetical protein [Caudoviricetes sp.]